MDKILIIGQAPPIQKQVVPYDTTLLYDIFSWVGITKEQAQIIFEFEAISAVFPGHTKSGGHKGPLKSHVKDHAPVLIKKISTAKKVILLGRPSIDNVFIKGAEFFQANGKYVLLPHPSRRNWKLIHDNKELITLLLIQSLQCFSLHHNQTT